MAHPCERIEYNGKVYDSWEDLPQEALDLIRSQTPDTDGDGVPDIFQGGPVPDPVVVPRFTINGTTYDSLDDVPRSFAPTSSGSWLQTWLPARHSPNAWRTSRPTFLPCSTRR